MAAFSLCLGCHRHVRSEERCCPFCGDRRFTTRRGVLLDASAARSKRHAAGVALLAGGAALGCGGSGETGANVGTLATAGDTSTNGAGSNSTSGGGATTMTILGAGGVASAGAANAAGGGATATGSAGSGNGVMAQPTGRACGDEPDVAGCRWPSDCPVPAVPLATVNCQAAPFAQNPGCGNPAFLSVCLACEEGFVCRPTDACGSSACVPVCDPATCTGQSGCVAEDCVPKTCDADGGAPCPEGFRCDPALAGANRNCVALRCDAGEYECASFQQCAGAAPDEHGCGLTQCGMDEDCGDCGYCVRGYCRATLGTCVVDYQQVAMPYGCVWPDEEFV